ncbi:hypothetical protein [Piscinibacter sp. XHJ-5]|uniref:hypothetical protein n=1 Tax=Piscinibacter sp. XHJ-5 TaxID=3037797 RepID=UPI002452EE4E|nr:hypothetical protein [Piscinibacter sp. XHJ-5]
MTHCGVRPAPRPAACLSELPRWLRAGLVGLGLAGCGVAASQPISDPLVVAPAHIRLGIEKLKLPGGENMGLVGSSYLIDLGHGFSAGPAVYGAISGRRGGLFTVGGELAWQHALAGPLSVDLGFYAGGGGGGSAPVGGGLMLRPHADLLWDFGPFLAGVSASRVRFANGDIDSRQLGLVWKAKTDFRYVPRDRIGERSDLGGRSGMGFDRVQAVVGTYRPRPGARLVSGGELSRSIGFVGARLERAAGNHLYWGIEAGGAARGGVAGYAEFLGTVGSELTVWPDVLTVGGRAAFGMGGGGDVDVGGGLLTKAAAYATLRLSRELGLSLEGGLTQAPQGSFKARHAALSLNWILDDPSDLTAPPRNTRTEWAGGVERYEALRRDGSRRALQAVSLKANRFVTQHLYLTGQVHSAAGGGAGGYTAGLIGVGLQSPVGGRWHVGGEAVIGAAGGGGIETRGGAIVQPSAYIGYDLSPSLSLRVGAGRIKSLKNDGLDANMVDVVLAFTFGVAGHGYR